MDSVAAFQESIRRPRGLGRHRPFGDSVEFLPGTSRIEPGHTPVQPVTLNWSTFKDAADQAGISRRYGGIHFEIGDLTGRVTGRLVADQAWAKAVNLWSGGTSEDDSGNE